MINSRFLGSSLTGLLLGFLVLTNNVFAKPDLSVSESDITFSKDKFFSGDIIRIYARVSNIGDADVAGFVVFSLNDRQLADPQPISIKTNTYDDVFVDWTAEPGTFDIKTEIIRSSPIDEIDINNGAVKKDFFIDSDTDGDKIGNKDDPDIDGDGLSNEKELELGTDSGKKDTDGDKISDSIDGFPSDPTEWRDTNNNDIGDNSDPDADGDGILNNDEMNVYGTNPLNSDSDEDGISDNNEIEKTTNPNKADTDGDGVNDGADKYPLDPSIWEASAIDSIKAFLDKIPYGNYIIQLIPVSLIILFLFFRRRRKRRR